MVIARPKRTRRNLVRLVQYGDFSRMSIFTFVTTLGISIALVVIVIAFGIVNDEDS